MFHLISFYTWSFLVFFFFFFNDTATTEIYTLSLHDALPICEPAVAQSNLRELRRAPAECRAGPRRARRPSHGRGRSEEHTSELQSRQYLVCRLLLEKKKKKQHSSRMTLNFTVIKMRNRMFHG